MHIAIMQPYLLPYIGYFQLMHLVDRFVIYDTIEYTKKGWINRNRMLRNGEPVTFSVPLKKASDFLDIRERNIAESYEPSKLRNQIAGAYAKAPEFEAVMPTVWEILSYQSNSLFDFLHHGLERTCTYIGIRTPLIVSSDIEQSSGLRNQDRVLAICDRMQADQYTNPIGGIELYEHAAFAKRGVKLQFLKCSDIRYPQFGDQFQPSLSILDVMMFNTRDRILDFLENGYELVDPRTANEV